MDKAALIESARKQWPQLADTDTLHDMWLRKFESDSRLQGEFENNFPAYFFFCLAEKAGSFRIQGGRR